MVGTETDGRTDAGIRTCSCFQKFLAVFFRDVLRIRVEVVKDVIDAVVNHLLSVERIYIVHVKSRQYTVKNAELTRKLLILLGLCVLCLHKKREH